MTFRLTLWATVATALTLLILIGLGTWQLDRLVWKQQILETRAARVIAPAMTYAEATTAVNTVVELAEYRPIRLRGRYGTEDSLKLLSRTRNGRPGFHIIAPLMTEAGGNVLVDRGWVPTGGNAEIVQLPSDVVSVEGYVRRFETPGRFTPDNEPAAGAWFYLDRDQMASALGLASLWRWWCWGVCSPACFPGSTRFSTLAA